MISAADDSLLAEILDGRVLLPGLKDRQKPAGYLLVVIEQVGDAELLAAAELFGVTELSVASNLTKPLVRLLLIELMDRLKSDAATEPGAHDVS
jgi:hypothetical protein